jgi:hypothetical protein
MNSPSSGLPDLAAHRSRLRRTGPAYMRGLPSSVWEAALNKRRRPAGAAAA